MSVIDEVWGAEDLISSSSQELFHLCSTDIAFKANVFYIFQLTTYISIW